MKLNNEICKFINPMGLAVDDENFLYVCDSNMIKKINLDTRIGTILYTDETKDYHFNTYTFVPERRISRFHNLLLDAEGNIYATKRDQCLQKNNSWRLK